MQDLSYQDYERPLNTWGFEPSKHQAELLKAWYKFIRSGIIESTVVLPHIAESWIRSRQLKVDPFRITSQCYLNQSQYLERIRLNKKFVKLATPIVKNVFKSFGETRHVIALYDADGYHLMVLAQKKDLQIRVKYGLRKGLCYDEHYIGTSAFSLAKKLEKPMRIVGCEHYSSVMHNIVGVSAPIFEPHTKNLMGVITVGGVTPLPYPQAESIVIAASTAIENLLELDQAKEKLFIYSKSLHVTIDSLEDGIILVDRGGCIQEMNLAARLALGLRVIDVSASHIYDLPQFVPLREFVKAGLQFADQEERQTELLIGPHTYLVKAKGICKENEEIQGVLVQLKNIRDLSRTIQKMTGEKAKYTFNEVTGSSRPICEVKKQAEIAAMSGAPVIIEGETGTGKEVLAHAIHNASPRKLKSFVAVNCAAIPFELLESIIFGHEKGAFTGAVDTHIGKFELADGGTLLLDEIAEMPFTLQAKLLRCIEEQEIERVGGKRPFSVDVRILATTNKNLFDQVQKHLFREDLFFRLNVFRIVLPPLRERKEDILELTHYFINEFALLFKKPLPRLSEEYVHLLLKYGWPGNIRELKNAIQYSMTRLEGNTLSPAQLIGFFRDVSDDLSGPKEAAGGKRLIDIERKIIVDTLRSLDGNKAETAKALGIGRATLYRKLRSESQPNDVVSM